MLREHIMGVTDSSVHPAVADEVKRTLVTMVDALTPAQQKQLEALATCSYGMGLREYCVLLPLYRAMGTVGKNPPPVHPTDPSSSWEPSMLVGLYPWVRERLGGLSRRIHGYVVLCEALRRAGSDITLVETIEAYRLPDEWEKFSVQVTTGFEMLLLWVAAQYRVPPSEVSVFVRQYIAYSLKNSVDSFVLVARDPFQHPLKKTVPTPKAPQNRPKTSHAIHHKKVAVKKRGGGVFPVLCAAGQPLPHGGVTVPAVAPATGCSDKKPHDYSNNKHRLNDVCLSKE